MSACPAPRCTFELIVGLGTIALAPPTPRIPAWPTGRPVVPSPAPVAPAPAPPCPCAWACAPPWASRFALFCASPCALCCLARGRPCCECCCPREGCVCAAAEGSSGGLWSGCCCMFGCVEREALIRSRSLWHVWHALFWHVRTCCSSMRFTCPGSSCFSLFLISSCVPRLRPPATGGIDGRCGATPLLVAAAAPRVVLRAAAQEFVGAPPTAALVAAGPEAAEVELWDELRVRCSACQSLQTLHSCVGGGAPCCCACCCCRRIAQCSTCADMRLSTCFVSWQDFWAQR
mmetsp:Transcript_958/g.1930  ORF Transcript_958/g.1930 Transcript_958/m.1930 type:complete len:289 (-) Transcript_958:416-1282(-)